MLGGLALLLRLDSLGDSLVDGLVHHLALGGRRRALLSHLAALLVVNHLLEFHDISRVLRSLGSDRLSNRLLDVIDGSRSGSNGTKSKENNVELHFDSDDGGRVVVV